MSGNITLRPAQRSDIPRLTQVANAANGKSVLHKRMVPYQDQYPISYYHWRLNIIRQRFATPELRNIVAVESSSNEIVGLACWAVEGPDTPLYKKWVGESTWADWLEGQLIGVEKTWSRYFTDKSTDYGFLKKFMAAFLGTDRSARPPCLHLHQIVVDPSTQSKGIGRILIDWGKELALREGLPLFMEANLEVTGFYEKGGFARLSKDVIVTPDGQEPIIIPAFAWEGKEREGRWLERDGSFAGEGVRWKWRDDVLPK